MFTKVWLIDTAERVAATFVVTFASVIMLSSLAGWKVAGMAGVAAALSALKAAFASFIGDPHSASLVPGIKARLRSQ